MIRVALESGRFFRENLFEEYDYPVTTPSGRIVNPPAGRAGDLKENFEVEDG